MNKRIYELADRAGEYADFESGLCTDDFLKKFAELIVHDCRVILAKVCRKTPLELQLPLVDLDETIIKHFGVEE